MNDLMTIGLIVLVIVFVIIPIIICVGAITILGRLDYSNGLGDKDEKTQ